MDTARPGSSISTASSRISVRSTPSLAVRVLSGRATLVGFDTDSGEGIPDAERAVELARSLDDPDTLGHAYLALGLSLSQASRHDSAFAEFRSAHAAFEDAGNDWGMGWATIFPAWIYRMQADVEASERWIDVARGHFDAAGSNLGLAWALTTKGIMARYRFEFEESVALHEEAMLLLHELGDRQGVAFCHSVISISLYQDGKVVEAAARWEQANAIERELGTVSTEGLSVGADAYRATGDLNAGFRLLLEARTLLDNTDATAMVVIAETVADYAVDLDIFGPSAELVAYATAERIRVNRPIPGPFQAGRDMTDAAIAALVDDVDAVNEAWERKELADVIPLIVSTLDEVGSALAAIEP